MLYAFFLFDCFLFHDYEIVGNLETLRNSDPWTAQGMLFRAFLNGFFFIFLWIAFLLIGMWLGRQDVRHPRTRWTVFLWWSRRCSSCEVCFMAGIVRYSASYRVNFLFWN